MNKDAWERVLVGIDNDKDVSLLNRYERYRFQAKLLLRELAAAERSALFYLEEQAHYKTQLASVQARLDAVMMEYCPDEMAPEQIANWQANQRPATTKETGVIDAAVKRRSQDE